MRDSVLFVLLTASNIDFSDILEPSLYFVGPSWCFERPKIVPNLMDLKKDHTNASVYQWLYMEIRDRYSDYIPV